MKIKTLLASAALLACPFAFGGLMLWEVDTPSVPEGKVSEWSKASPYAADSAGLSFGEGQAGIYDGKSKAVDAFEFASRFVVDRLKAYYRYSSSWSIYEEFYNAYCRLAGYSGMFISSDDTSQFNRYVRNCIDMDNLAEIRKWSSGAYDDVP